MQWLPLRQRGTRVLRSAVKGCVALLMVIVLSGVAPAQNGNGYGAGGGSGQGNKGNGNGNGGSNLGTPEIDAGAIVTATAILAGGVMVLTARRRRQ